LGPPHAAPAGTAIKVRRIPKNSTGLILPLDVYGFRPVKNIIRRMADMVLLQGLDFQISVRDNIIKFQSLVWNQLAAKRYHEMWKMGRYMTGYLTNHPQPFVTPVQFCLGDSLSRETVPVTTAKRQQRYDAAGASMCSA